MPPTLTCVSLGDIALQFYYGGVFWVSIYGGMSSCATRLERVWPGPT